MMGAGPVSVAIGLLVLGTGTLLYPAGAGAIPHPRAFRPIPANWPLTCPPTTSELTVTKKVRLSESITLPIHQC